MRRRKCDELGAQIKGILDKAKEQDAKAKTKKPATPQVAAMPGMTPMGAQPAAGPKPLVKGTPVTLKDGTKGTIKGGNPNEPNGGRWMVTTPKGSVLANGKDLQAEPIAAAPTPVQQGQPAAGAPRAIGKPLPKRIEQIKALVAKGQKVVVFSVEADNPELHEALQKVGLGDLPVTNIKGPDFGALLDNEVNVKTNANELMEIPPIPAGKALYVDFDGTLFTQPEASNQVAKPEATKVPTKSQRTYEEVQRDIDREEDKLEASGQQVTKLYFPEHADVLKDAPGWKPMPEHMVNLYAERDAIGSGQLQQSVSEISNALRKAGIIEDAELRRVLEYYALDSNRTDAAKQYMASEYTKETVDRDPKKQAADIYSALAPLRDIFMDDRDDLWRDRKLTQDSISAVKAVVSYFNGGEPVNIKGILPEGAPANEQRVSTEQPAAATPDNRKGEEANAVQERPSAPVLQREPEGDRAEGGGRVQSEQQGNEAAGESAKPGREKDVRKEEVAGTPRARFLEVYTRTLRDAVKKYPERYTWPIENVPTVAEKMTVAMARGTANMDTPAIKNALKELGVKATRKAVEEFFAGKTEAKPSPLPNRDSVLPNVETEKPDYRNRSAKQLADERESIRIQLNEMKRKGDSQGTGSLEQRRQALTDEIQKRQDDGFPVDRAPVDGRGEAKPEAKPSFSAGARERAGVAKPSEPAQNKPSEASHEQPSRTTESDNQAGGGRPAASPESADREGVEPKPTGVREEPREGGQAPRATEGDRAPVRESPARVPKPRPESGPGAGSDAELDSSPAQPVVEKAEKQARKRVKRNTEWFEHPTDWQVPGGTVTRLDNNIAALEILRDVEKNHRTITDAEKTVLANYVGWGSLSRVFDEDYLDKSYYELHPDRSWGAETERIRKEAPEKARWRAANARLRELLSKEEYDAAKTSTINAHYTSPELVRFMWDAVQKMGFKSGNVLEPSLGVGNFFGMMPSEIRSQVNAIGNDMDPVTSGIAKLLYPGATIFTKPFEDLVMPNNEMDLAISNVPFFEGTVYDPKYPKIKANLHDYFFVKSLDKVKPGGLVAFITSTGTMDKQNSAIRDALSAQADLVTAYRLPSSAFKANAGTDVTTDLIILRKRLPDEAPAGESWLRSTPTDIPLDKGGMHELSINEYFQAHPDHMLGTAVASGKCTVALDSCSSPTEHRSRSNSPRL